MSIPIGSIGVTPPVASPTSPTQAAAESDKDMFLKLLLAQMKYQDPSNPTDSTQFLSQMASFTEVEKLETLADGQASMLTSSQLQTAVSMVGDTVAYGVGKDSGSGKVTGVTVIDGVPQLLIGTAKVELSTITSVTS